MKQNNQPWTSFFLILLFWFIYVGIGLITPLSRNTLGLDPLQLRLLQFSFYLPILVTWLLGTFASSSLRKYSHGLEDREQKNAFNNISHGVSILIITSVITSISGNLRSYFQDSQVLTATFTIINNYLYVFPTLISMYLFYEAGKNLVRSLKFTGLTFFQRFVSLILPTIIIGLYIYFILTNPTRQFSDLSGVMPTFYLPDLLIFSTIVLPLFIAWILGAESIYLLGIYRSKTTGAVFQSSLQQLSYGFFCLIFSSMFLQLLLSLGSTRLVGQSLFILLTIIYLFVFIQGLGYLLLHLGSRKLAHIDQVLEKYVRGHE